MSFIDEYRKRFKEKESLEGIDEDALWGNISDALDNDLGQPEKDRNKRKYRFILFFLPLGILAGLMTINSLNNFNDNKTTSELNITTEIIKDKNNDLRENNSSTSRKEEIEDIMILENKNNKEQNVIRGNYTDFSSNKFDVNFNKNEIQSKENYDVQSNVSRTNINGTLKKNEIIGEQLSSSIYLETLINDNTKQLASTSYPKTIITNIEGNGFKQIAPDDKSKTLNDDVNNSTLSRNEGFYDKVPSIMLVDSNEESPLWLDPLLLSSTYSIGDKSTRKNISKIDMNEKSNQWEIGTFVGGDFVFNSFKENDSNPDLNDKLNESNSIELGYFAAFNAYWNCKDKFHIKTGLEFIEHQLQYETVHMYQTVASRTGFSGQEEFVPATASRTIVHDNKFRHLSIPLEIGIRQNFRKFDIGISAGFGLNFLVSQAGKSLDYNNEIRSLKNNEAYPRASISYQMNPFVSYHMTNKMSLRLNQQIRYQNHSTSDFYGLKQSSILIGLNMGVVYKL